MFRVWIVVIFLIGIGLGSPGCDNIPKYEPMPFSRAVDCITQRNFDVEREHHTLDQVIKYMEQLYVYRDINQDSGFPYFIKVDVVKELKDLRLKKDWNSDYEFQQAIQKIFIKMRDAHTVYAPPACYVAWNFYFPISIDVTKEGDDLRFHVGRFEGAVKTIAKNYTTLYQNENPQKYEGWEITAIDGEPPIDFLKRFADDYVGYSRDEGIRFNYLLKRGWMQRNLMRDLVPKKEEITFSFKKEETVEDAAFKFYAVSRLSFVSNKAFDYYCMNIREEEEDKEVTKSFKERITNNRMTRWTSNFFQSMSPVSSKSQFFFPTQKEFIDPFVHAYQKLIHLKDVNVPMIHHRLIDDVTIPKVSKRDISCKYKSQFHSKGDEFEFLTNDNIGVLRVTTFIPSGLINLDGSKTIGNPLNDYLVALQSAFESIDNSNVDKLIVDLRGNTGGVICFAWLLAQYLSPYAPFDPSPAADLIYSEFGDQIHCGKNLIDKVATGIATSRGPLPNDWFVGGKTYSRGKNKDSKYTKEVVMGCQLILISTFGNLTYSPKKQFEPNDLILLTDGTSGSAAGMFLKLFQYLNLAKIVNMGGYPKTEMSIASFKGAAVMLHTAFLQTLAVSLCPIDYSLAPEHFKTSSLVTYSWLECYPWAPKVSAFELDKGDRSQPLGYIRKVADFHLDSWKFSATEEIYDQVVPLFSKCASWEILKSSTCEVTTQHGIFGHPCIMGSFDRKKCTLRGCEKGYYLTSKQKCEKMPYGFDSVNILMKFAAIFLLVVFSLLALVISVFVVLCVCLCRFATQHHHTKLLISANQQQEIEMSVNQ